jgi:hypothetical protein
MVTQAMVLFVLIEEAEQIASLFRGCLGHILQVIPYASSGSVGLCDELMVLKTAVTIYPCKDFMRTFNDGYWEAGALYHKKQMIGP